jgi:hypothetical protein
MREPSDEELLAFAGALLSNLDRELWGPAVLEEAVSDRRALWLLLYKASLGSQELGELSE